jgi:hypothetical protein
MNSTGRTYNRNDLVTLDSLFQRPGDAGKVWKVTKAPTARNQVNYLIEPVNGGVGLRVKGYMLQPATEAEQAAAKAIAAAVPLLEPLHAGQVVTVTGHSKVTPTDRYVVLGQKADDKVKLVKLGGEGGRYWPSIPRTLLTVVPV